MPVIIEPDEEELWLETEDVDEFLAMSTPFREEQTQRYEVSTAVNSPANDRPDLVEPVYSAQSGLAEFG